MRTGAHAIHLTGSAYAGPFACGVCHEVPTDLTHISGREARGSVALLPPWATVPDLAGYDPVNRTCATACHGVNPSPAWESSGMACNGCHGVPPSTLAHAGLPDATNDPADRVACAGCHPTTIAADGSMVPGGTHLNGARDGGHPDGYVAPDRHGRDFFAFASGGGGACTACHGATYAEPIATGGRSCNSCHADSGWVSSGGAPNWQTNCSFCHGVEDATTRAGYVLASNPTWSAPPQAISERLSGIAAPDRTGAHAIHLTGSAYARAFECSVCHEVPTALTHISGREARARVALLAPGQAGVPDETGYDAGTGTCGTACHGASRSPAWTSTGLACDGCHGVPPASSIHAGLPNAASSMAARIACAGCHPTTIAPDGAILSGGTHINGTVDRVDGHEPVGLDPYVVQSVHGSQYLSYLASVPGATDCTSCHGTSLALCDSCHSHALSGSWVNWQTNCTFCHGTKTATYTAANLTLASPPDAVSARLNRLTSPASLVPFTARTGKHRQHLNGKAGYNGYACATCHTVPTTAAHVSADRRATVTFDPVAAFPTLTAEELAALPDPIATYDTGGPIARVQQQLLPRVDAGRGHPFVLPAAVVDPFHRNQQLLHLPRGSPELRTAAATGLRVLRHRLQHPLLARPGAAQCGVRHLQRLPYGQCVGEHRAAARERQDRRRVGLPDCRALEPDHRNLASAAGDVLERVVPRSVEGHAGAELAVRRREASRAFAAPTQDG